jgi:siroheme synthase (precorrin-2 oxidase/ferrochelatase)
VARTGDAPQFAYPVSLDLHGVDVLVVGAGPVAARKVDGLAAAGARVHVVAPVVSADLEGRRLVLTATDAETDATVAADATAAGLWVNAADRREHCSFILPAVARNGPLTVAVGTDGASPALAGALRDRARPLVADAVVALARRLAAERAAVQAAGDSTEDLDWRPSIDGVLDDQLGPRRHPPHGDRTGT